MYIQCLLHTQEVTGSSPVLPTTTPVLLQKESSVLEILEIIFGPELRRRLMVRQMSNDELFLKYHPELRLSIHNEVNLKNDVTPDHLSNQSQLWNQGRWTKEGIRYLLKLRILCYD